VRQQYEASDARHTLELPPAEPLQQDSERLRAALEARASSGGTPRRGQELLAISQGVSPSAGAAAQDPGVQAAPGS